MRRALKRQQTHNKETTTMAENKQPDPGNREDRFTATELEWSQCVRCKHYEGGGGCPAFPDGIPYMISTNGWDHVRPWPGGDNGVQFELREGLAEVTL